MTTRFDPRVPLREDLALFLPNKRLIRAFEQLFRKVGSDAVAGNPQNLVNTGLLDSSATDVYTSSDVRTIIDSTIVYNGSGAPVTFMLNLVPAGGSVGPENLIISESVADKATFTADILVDQVLENGDVISITTSTPSALVFRMSGRVVAL